MKWYCTSIILNNINSLILRYNLTLCASKRDSVSCASQKISVVRGKIPTFVLAAKDTKVNPNKKLVIKGKVLLTALYSWVEVYYVLKMNTSVALVDNAAGACVVWSSVAEEGLAYLELPLISSRSADTACFAPGSANTRGFHLVIPPGALEAGLK